MATKITITGGFKIKDKLKALKTPVDRVTANEVGVTVVKLIRKLTASGLSTVREFGRRMPKYRGSYRRRIREGRIRGKRLSPVNLRLSGKFMKSLKFKLGKSRFGVSTVVGYFNKKSEDKEEGHRKGTNRQLKRPTIPETGESFPATIQNAITKIYRKRVRFIIKK